MTTLKIAQTVVEIPTSLITPDPNQPRKKFDPEYIEGLGASIKAEGLLQPITVRPNPELPGSYWIVAGECRWRGHCHAGIQSVKCIVSHKLTDDSDRYRKQVMENMTRRDMSLKEESVAVAKLSEMGDTDDKIGTALGLSKTRVRNLIRLSELSDASWMLIENGAIFPTFAEAVVATVPKEHVETLLIRCAGKGRNVAVAMMRQFVCDLNQAEFEMTLASAGIDGKASQMINDHVMMLAAARKLVANLSGTDRTSLAINLGSKLARDTKPTEENTNAAAFLSRLFLQAKSTLLGELD